MGLRESGSAASRNVNEEDAWRGAFVVAKLIVFDQPRHLDDIGYSSFSVQQIPVAAAAVGERRICVQKFLRRNASELRNNDMTVFLFFTFLHCFPKKTEIDVI